MAAKEAITTCQDKLYQTVTLGDWVCCSYRGGCLVIGQVDRMTQKQVTLADCAGWYRHSEMIRLDPDLVVIYKLKK
jgi:hypothetical protein